MESGERATGWQNFTRHFDSPRPTLQLIPSQPFRVHDKTYFHPQIQTSHQITQQPILLRAETITDSKFSPE